MVRLGGMYGPDVTAISRGSSRRPRQPGRPGGRRCRDSRCSVRWGTSHRAGARFGPHAIRVTDYLAHDASRPHLALRVDPLQDMTVVDAGDVEMPAGVAAPFPSRRTRRRTPPEPA